MAPVSDEILADVKSQIMLKFNGFSDAVADDADLVGP